MNIIYIVIYYIFQMELSKEEFYLQFFIVFISLLCPTPSGIEKNILQISEEYTLITKLPLMLLKFSCYISVL